MYQSYFLYKEGLYGTSTFLSITIIEEIAKVHIGLYIKKYRIKNKRLLKKSCF